MTLYDLSMICGSERLMVKGTAWHEWTCCRSCPLAQSSPLQSLYFSNASAESSCGLQFFSVMIGELGGVNDLNCKLRQESRA